MGKYLFNLRWLEAKEDAPGIEHVKPTLKAMLDDLNAFCGNNLVVHCMYDDERDPGNYHRLGLAADLHMDHWHPFDQFIAAGRMNFGGIGVYGADVWKHPGLHVDLRTAWPHARWGCRVNDTGKREYCALDKRFITRLLTQLP